MTSSKMKPLRISLLLLMPSTAQLAAADGAGADLDAALKTVAAFEYGKDAGPLELVERQVLAASGDAPRRAALEAKLLGALRGAATRDAKEFLCRQLRVVASGRSVPQLESMLRDPELSPLARFALERLDDPAAGQALVHSLSATSGKTLVGILSSIGRRRERGAAGEVAKQLGAPDASVARAAAVALGAIGGAEAAGLLTRARGSAAAALAIEIEDALLACADGFVAAGSPADAASIYRTFLEASRPRHHRLAAIHGLAAAGGPAGLEAITAALRDADPELRLGAIDACIALDRGSERSEATTRALAAVLPALAPETQALLVPALASRPGEAALASVLDATASVHAPVRAAALAALGRIGGPAQVELLLRAASASEETTAAAARGSLLELRGEAIDAAIARAIAAAAFPVRREGLRALAARRATGSFARVLPLASDDDAGTRQEAIAALGVLAGAGDIPRLTALIVKPREGADRPALETAAAAALHRLPAAERSAELVLGSLRGAPEEARPSLVRLLDNVGDAAALGAARAALVDAGAATRVAAVGALADWPDAAPVEDLFRLASALDEAASKETALRGYVRLAGLSAETVEPYRRALAIAARPEERAIVLEGLGGVALPEALDLVEPLLAQDDAIARAAAARTVVAIADRIRGLDAARARAAVEKALAATTDAELRRRGRAVIDQIEKYQGHVLAWAISGPYREEGKDARAIFDAALAPETGGETAWRRLRRGVGEWGVDLARALGPADNAGAYVRSTIVSPDDREVRLELGSDDAIKAWLNGALVHASFTSRGLEVASDRVDASLRRGPNELLLKVVNQGGPWGFACRVRARDGSLLRDLKVEPALRAPASDGSALLFDGKSLEGWEQKGGKAEYRVEDGAIVGRTVPNTQNSFLCTRKIYGDFVLEYEFRCDAALNSGVQVRSQVLDAEMTHELDGKKIKVPAGRVHGYQVEIDPDKPERSWVGGVYEEGRRGWLYPGSRGGDAAKFSEQGRRLYRKGDWNQVRIEAIGPSIKTWLNGELRAELQDDLTPRGFVALQVHGVGARAEPLEVRWRSLRLRELGGKGETRQ